MKTNPERLRPTEAAFVAGVALRDVNRVIDEDILPAGLCSRDEGRSVLALACPLIGFYFAGADRLTAGERLVAIRRTDARLRRFPSLARAARAGADWTLRDALLSIDFGAFVTGASDRLERLALARARVVSTPDILGGTPVLRGTRVPVHDVAASVAAGIALPRILAAWPGLDAETVALAALYADANPARGRPRITAGLPQGAVVLSERSVPRRGKAA